MYQRVGESFQPLPFALVGEHFLAQRGAIEAAIGEDQGGAKMIGDRRQRGPAGLHHQPGGDVRIHHRNAQALEAPGDGRFSAADAAGDPDHQSHQFSPAADR